MNTDLAAYSARLRAEFSGLDAVLMEVCGTHTNAIRQAGIDRLLPPGVTLLSGPGCPVCVTGSGYIESAIQLSKNPKVIIASFGDLLKVPGNTATLSEARAGGGRVQVVYSPLDAVELAQANPQAEVVFLGVGFETTAPVIGLAIQAARADGVRNFSVLPALKILEPAMRALLSSGDLRINGLIAPGHLSVIIGAEALRFLVDEYRLPTVVTGFRPAEIWLGIAALLRQIRAGTALLEMRPDYLSYDARSRFNLEPVASLEPPGCRCGLILIGRSTPQECPHFGRSCRPEHPVGPCMVSGEGTCAAHYISPGTEQ
jgi:hydrogenase expression/formation protein HypD